MPGGFYYVTGARSLLQGSGEWWYDAPKKKLYLWAPHNANPNKLDIEAKQRTTVIDLSSRSNVTNGGNTWKVVHARPTALEQTDGRARRCHDDRDDKKTH